MRQINVYSFGEKIPEPDKKLIIIPSHIEGPYDFYRGKLEALVLPKCNMLYGLMPERRLYDIHWDDDVEYNNTPVNDILDWEWLYLEELQGDKQ